MMDETDDHGIYADEPRDPRAVLIIGILVLSFWGAVAAGVWAAGNAKGWW